MESVGIEEYFQKRELQIAPNRGIPEIVQEWIMSISLLP